tara:strand:+ start:4820 stop:5587 length:768 start_codon:yes stop_codon:yes gene_type:complete
VDPHAQERERKKEAKKKNLTAEGFKYSSPGHKSSGIGSSGNYGLLGSSSMFSHEPEYEVDKKGDKPVPRAPEPRQVVTSPSKKGYGASTPGTTFGPGPRKGEQPKMGKEYEHSPDPYDLARQFEREERKFNAKKGEGRPPYKTMGHSYDYFDSHEKVAAPKGLTEDPRMPDKPPPESKAPPITVPFYPPQAPREGKLGTFGKFPQYMDDPLDEKMKAAREQAEKEKITTAAFKPGAGSKSTPTKSIAFHQPGVNM